MGNAIKNDILNRMKDALRYVIILDCRTDTGHIEQMFCLRSLVRYRLVSQNAVRQSDLGRQWQTTKVTMRNKIFPVRRSESSLNWLNWC